jgi:outer membrane receptor protein involved in Fe transport
MKKLIACLIVSLIAVPSHASDIFMSLTRSPIPVSDAPINTQVIYASDFEKTSARTVGDAIESAPGVHVINNGSEGSQQSVAIRGFTSQHVLIVIDDVPQTPDLTGNVDLSRIPLDNVERIEIIRGGGSAVYGPNAQGGVIHIITKKPVTKIDLQATSDAGSFSTFHNRAQFGTQQGPIQAQVTASRDLSDGFQQNASYRNTFLSGFLAADAKRWGKLSYSGSGSDGTIGLPSGTPVPIGEWNGELERQANDLESHSNEKDRVNQLHYANHIGSANLTARLANNVKDLDAFQFGSDTLIRTEGRNGFGQIDDPNVGGAGYEYYQRRLDSNVYGDHRSDAWGTYVQAYFLRNDWFNLIPGVRYDEDNTYGEAWSPRVQAVVKPSDLWKVSASAARSFQPPTFADLYDPFVPPEFQPTDLRPEFTWTYDLGVSVKPATGLETALTLYHTDTKDRIALDPTRGFAAFNLNKAYTNGVEADVTYAYKIIRQNVAYTYLQAMGQNEGSEYHILAFSPKNKVDYRADIQLPWKSQIIYDAHYLGPQWTGINQTGVHIPDHVVMNARLSKAIGWAEFFVACNNLLDRHYAETADSFNGYFPMPGRNFLGGVTIRFLK